MKQVTTQDVLSLTTSTPFELSSVTTVLLADLISVLNVFVFCFSILTDRQRKLQHHNVPMIGQSRGSIGFERSIFLSHYNSIDYTNSFQHYMIYE